MGDVEVFTWWASGGGLSSPFDPASDDLRAVSPGTYWVGGYPRVDRGIVLHTDSRQVSAPNPIFEDWSEYDPFFEKRKCGFAATVTSCMWSGLLGAFLLAALLTIIILVVQ